MDIKSYQEDHVKDYDGMGSFQKIIYRSRERTDCKTNSELR